MCLKTSWEKKDWCSLVCQHACSAEALSDHPLSEGLWGQERAVAPSPPSPEQPGASWDLPFMSCSWGGKFSLLCRIAKGIYLGWLNLALKSTSWPQERRLVRQAGELGGHGEFITLVFLRGCARNCSPEPDTEKGFHYWVSLQFPCQTKYWTLWHSWWVSVVQSILNSLNFSFFSMIKTA